MSYPVLQVMQGHTQLHDRQRCKTIISIMLGAVIAVTDLSNFDKLPWSNANADTQPAAFDLGKPPKDHSSRPDTWIFNPNQPGANLPPTGRSLFDFVVTSRDDGKLKYDVPFPYSELINKIERYLQPDLTYNLKTKQVLIPLGRSLARNIARPDFFKFPRVVAAIDTYPTMAPDASGLMLKDRLYIGYGEAASILEVISYNEAAGRFEFQVVTDYKPGGVPKVYYANREVCMACHQNGALIFSRQQWDETNANPHIAARLKQENRDFYHVPIDRGVDVPFAIDAATDRGNWFALYQLLWQQGCNFATDPDTKNNHDDTQLRINAQCRADLLTYVLQYLLSGTAGFDQTNSYYQTEFLPQLTSNWQKHWPNGLLIPDPNLPNRNPLLMLADNTSLHQISEPLSSEATTVLNSMLAKNDVPNQFEPLVPRPPLQTWHAQDFENIHQLIKGLSGFIATADITRLDRQLKLKGVITNQQSFEHPLSCHNEVVRIDNKLQRIKFDCQSDSDKIQPRFGVKGRFELIDNDWQNGKLTRLTVNGQSLFDLTLTPIQVKTHGNERIVSIHVNKLPSVTSTQPGSEDTNVRLPTGNSVQTLTIHWNYPSRVGGYETQNTHGQLVILDDFSLARQAIQTMVQQTLEHESDAFADLPFRRASIIKTLFANLTMESLHWCCLDDADMPEPVAQDLDNPTAILASDANPETAPFYHYCAACHRGTSKFPPNFLYGDAQQVDRNITQCAPRIFFRLAMWQIREAQREKSPMPPATALFNLGFTQEHWPSSDEYLSLQHTAAKRIKSSTQSQPSLQDYIKTGFDNLPECLPQ